MISTCVCVGGGGDDGFVHMPDEGVGGGSNAEHVYMNTQSSFINFIIIPSEDIAA